MAQPLSLRCFKCFFRVTRLRSSRKMLKRCSSLKSKLSSSPRIPRMPLLHFKRNLMFSFQPISILQLASPPKRYCNRLLKPVAPRLICSSMCKITDIHPQTPNQWSMNPSIKISSHLHLRSKLTNKHTRTNSSQEIQGSQALHTICLYSNNYRINCQSQAKLLTNGGKQTDYLI